MRVCQNWEFCFGSVILCLLGGCGWTRTGATTPPGNGSGAVTKTVDIEALRPQVKAFCGDCHSVPPATSFAKEEWPEEVALGYDLYHRSGRFDLDEPPQAKVTAYFQALAPEQLAYSKPVMASHPLPVRFRQQSLARSSENPMAAVAALSWQAEEGSNTGKLLFSDMRRGNVSEIRLVGGTLVQTELGNLRHPAIIEPADLNGDGITDYLVGDLGSFLPADHNKGRVLWLHGDEQRGWTVEELATGLGRVAQAVSGDFDGDADLDVLVAEFGWRTTGRILMLKREGDPDGAAQYEQVVIDPRHGTSNLRVIDWEGDGDLDFVALITQEHEKVELFRNAGDGKFDIETIFAAGDPAFGSGDVELADIDGDGDFDVLHTNGDAMDSRQLKPYHAVRWLENEGQFPFTPHEITQLPGAFKAVAADFDGDKDLDVVVFAFPPRDAGEENLPSWDELVFLEQTEGSSFTRHTLDAPKGGVALAAADFDGDGDVDLATGAFNEGPDTSWVTIWWNDGRHEAAPSTAP